MYNAQHKQLGQEWVDGFTKETGIKVQVRDGKDFELANQILAEGDASPADVFITENSPAISLLSSKGVLAPLDAATIAQVPAQYRSGADDWVGIAARSTVLVYNPSLLPADQLPQSIMELSRPQWKDRVGIAAGGADFQAIVSAVYAVNGDAAAGEWLAGLKQNARVYQGNVAIMKAVNAGEIPAGVIYHYYWYRDRAESGQDSKNTELKYFGNQDAGAFVSVSGGGVLKSAKHPAEAQRFIAYLTGKAGQQVLANSYALEYPVGSGVAADTALKPLSELDPPVIDPNTLNGPQVISEMQRVGLL
ncbi:iron ABC transporter substrate-binding protein [Pseudonocardia hispaniensis]|uniref:Iron ABC transporter substrate-binding protein n=1 Tax=Pseudonocardia hispaniensis TaxID=904933 RepID=A0ABW1IZ35_9PSEU